MGGEPPAGLVGLSFAHADWLRGDRALHALLGIARFPGDDTVRNFSRRFAQAHSEAFWRCCSPSTCLAFINTGSRYQQPATLRSQVFVAGAILGLIGKQAVLKLFEAWGGLTKHKPLLDAVLKWPTITSPKLEAVAQTTAPLVASP